MWNLISRVEGLLGNGGPWWWRPIGTVLSLVLLGAIYWILS